MTDRTSHRRTSPILFGLSLCMMLMGLTSAFAGEPSAPNARPEPQTDIEKFIAGRGMLIVKDFYDVGKVRSSLVGTLEVDLLVSSTPKSGTVQRRFGVRLNRPGVERYESDALSLLDFDECGDALAALEFMKDLAGKMAAEDHEYTEVVYVTRGGASFGFFQSGRNQRAFVQVGGPIGEKNVFLNMSGLWEVHGLLKQAVNRLEQLGAG